MLGIGSGSTVNCLIALLAANSDINIAGAVAASQETRSRLLAQQIPVLELKDVELTTYIDGADEVDAGLCLVKGGGGALTLEKIIAQTASDFICIADDSKLVARLGGVPLPIEVIPSSQKLVTKQLALMNGEAKLREGFITDHGHHILTVSGLDFADPMALESAINDIPGVVCCGIFAHRRADALYVGTAGEGVSCLTL